MNNNYQWDLESVLENKSLEDLHQNWLKKQQEIKKLYPSFYKSLTNFKKWLKIEDEYEILSNRIFNYVQNNLQENQVDQKWLSWSQKLSVEANDFSVKLSDYTNILIENENKIKKYLKDKETSGYFRAFDLTFKNKPHILPKDQQKVLTKVGIINDGFDSVFSTLTDCDIKFEPAIDSKGKKIKLETVADVQINLKHKDRKIRETTWTNFNKAYANFESTLTQTLYYNYLMLNTYAKIHNHIDYVNAVAFHDEVSESFIIHIYEQVKKYKNTYNAYRKIADSLLKKQLKIKSLEPWDRGVDLIKKEIRFTIEESQQIAVDCLKPLGSEYISLIKKAFNENWISWLPKKNKQTGAYSIGGTHGLKKYFISMNFDKTIRSISTLVHELGHSMHSAYFNKHQKIYTSCSIFYAEIASIVNEVLLAYYWLNKYQNDKLMKRMVLEELINNFFATTTRQVVFSNFEYEANKLINKSEPFTKEKIRDLYLEMIEKYQGTTNKSKAKYKKSPYSYGLSTIFRISHFYVGNFYVYKYAIGQIAAIIIAKKIYNGDRNALKRYQDFLKSGSSKSPLETINILGIDLTKKEPYQEAINIVDEWIKELKK